MHLNFINQTNEPALPPLQGFGQQLAAASEARQLTADLLAPFSEWSRDSKYLQCERTNPASSKIMETTLKSVESVIFVVRMRKTR